jgi:hypothetical protein
MPSLATFLKSAKFKKSTSGVETATTTPEEASSPPPPPPCEKPEKRLPSLSPLPQLKVRRPNSIASLTSLNLLRRKDREDLESVLESDFLGGQKLMPSSPERGSQATSASNGLAALRIHTPSSFRSFETVVPPPVPKDTPRKSTAAQFSVPAFSAGASHSAQQSTKPSFLTLPQADSSFDTFNISIDFTKFEMAKVDPPTRREPSLPRRIENHDILFLIDDGPGIDHRQWDMICEIVHGLSKRLIPVLATVKDPASPPPELPPSAPQIAIRFVNHPRAVNRLTNLTQVRSIFSWVTPREMPKYIPSNAKGPRPSGIPPLHTLEYHFWEIYNEKLQKNAWVGQIPSTIILFASSPLGNRPEDMDLFVAKCAETLNADQVPLPLVSLVVVQCNTDPVLLRQLVDTRRMITWEWYTPRGRPSPPSPRKGAQSSMLNPYVPEQKKRPQRDWVDVITCMDWERKGGIASIKNLVEDELQQGIHRRRKVQREVAMAYLTHLGKEDSAPSTTRTKSSSSGTEVVNINPRSMYYSNSGGGVGMWTPPAEEHGFRGAAGMEVDAGGCSELDYTPDFLQHAKPVITVAPTPTVPSLSPASPRRIDYYD